MRVTTFECFEIQIVINVAPVSLRIKKVNFYTCPRLTFLKKNATVTENAYKSISEPLDFKIFWGACPQTPPAARAFGARNLPRLILKSGYGPVSSKNFNSFKDFQSDQIQTSSHKLFTAYYACSNSDLNLTSVTGTTNGFIFK